MIARRWLFGLLGVAPLAAFAKPAEPFDQVVVVPDMRYRPPPVQPTLPIRYIVKLADPPPMMVVGPAHSHNIGWGPGSYCHAVEARPAIEYIAHVPEGTVQAWVGVGKPPQGWVFLEDWNGRVQEETSDLRSYAARRSGDGQA